MEISFVQRVEVKQKDGVPQSYKFAWSPSEVASNSWLRLCITRPSLPCKFVVSGLCLLLIGLTVVPRSRSTEVWLFGAAQDTITSKASGCTVVTDWRGR